MAVQLNHTIVHAHDKQATARHLVERGHTPDSLTEGVEARSGDGWRGWAALLAPSLSAGPVQFTDLAVSGARTRACPSVSCPPRCGCAPRVASRSRWPNPTGRPCR